jgi:hypothetical protein
LTDPTVTCTACGRQRNCRHHMRADHPPTAAKAWLRKHCQMAGAGPKPCAFAYRAGLDVGGLAELLKAKE